MHVSPAGVLMTSLPTRSGCAIAKAAAIQPPSDSPARWARLEAEDVQNVEEMAGVVGDAVVAIGTGGVAVADQFEGDDE